MKEPLSKITPMVDLIRAHVWTDLGYSSKTFNAASEANAWIDLKMKGATKADQLPRIGKE